MSSSLFDAFKDIFAGIFARKQRDDQWAARYNEQPTQPAGKLPLDPGKSQLS